LNQLMTVQDLADYLRVTVKTIYRLLEHGNVPATRIGHLWRFNKDDIDNWLHQNTKKMTADILVIDDDESIRVLFKEALRDSGHTVSSAQNASEGLELITSGDYDLVFLDLLMPGTDGAMIFKQIRSVKPDLPVTIITGYPDSDLMMSAMNSGPFSVMKKPFTVSDILAVINNYLRFGMNVK
jgi:excisionase family DNA binding protein